MGFRYFPTTIVGNDMPNKDYNSETRPKTSYLATDKYSAINSRGEKFFIGETVGHQGAKDGDVAVIEKFIPDNENADIVVNTSKGTCTIEFLLKV